MARALYDEFDKGKVVIVNTQQGPQKIKDKVVLIEMVVNYKVAE